MKKNIYLLLILTSMGSLLWSCSKQATDGIATKTSIEGSAFIKIAHFSPAFRLAVNGSDSFNVYVNGMKLNGAFLTYGSLFPSVTNMYAAVPAGNNIIRLTMNGVLTPDSLMIATYTKSLVAGKYYSFIITDSLKSTSNSKQIFVEDNFMFSDTTTFTMRFVNAIMNDTAGKNVDVYSTRRASNIFYNISPGTVSEFVPQPYNFVTDTLIVRRAGSMFELARLSTASNPLGRNRAYTLVYKGLPGVLTTGTKGRSLVTFANQ